MATEDLDVIIDLHFQNALRDVKKWAATSKKAVDKVETGFKKVQNRLKSVGKSLINTKNLIVAAAATYAIRNFIQASNIQEAAVTRLNATLEKEGMFSEELSKSLQKLASDIQGVTTEGDELTISNIALMQNLGHLGANIIPEATKAAIGLSKVMGVDSTTAFRLLGRAASGNTELFTRYGITLDASLTDQQKFNELLRIGAQGFKLAEAEAKDSAGAMKQFSNVVGDLKESLGAAVKKVIIPAIKWFNNLNSSIRNGGLALAVIAVTIYKVAIPAVKAFGVALKVSTGWIGLVATAVVALIAVFATDFMGIRTKVIQVFKAIYVYGIASFDILWSTIKLFAKRFTNIFKNVGVVIKGALTLSWDKIKEGISGIKISVGAFAADVAEKTKKIWQAATVEVNNFRVEAIKNLNKVKDEVEHMMNDVMAADEILADSPMIARIVDATEAMMGGLKVIEEKKRLQQEDTELAIEGINRQQQGWLSLANTMSSSLAGMVMNARGSFSAILQSFKNMLTRMLIELAAKAVIFTILRALGAPIPGGFWGFAFPGLSKLKAGGGDVERITNNYFSISPSFQSFDTEGMRKMFRSEFIPMIKEAQLSGLL